MFGGNVDNWRFGPGATVRYPVFVEGAGFYVGDPHFAQGDGEICGTAIEASLDVRLRLSVERGVTDPVARSSRRRPTGSPTASATTSTRRCGWPPSWSCSCSSTAAASARDEAYSLASVAVDLGVTQVVDGTLGCHAAIPKDAPARP